MKRSAPLQRSAWLRHPPAPPERARPAPALLQPAAGPRAVLARVDDLVRAAPKEELLRSEAYRRLVAQMPCQLCGRQGRSQAAHPNTGKGLNLKTDDRLTFALCADDLGVRGCHALFDQGGLFDKETRRGLEQAWGAATRQRIELAGLWPAGLPRWDELTDHPDDEEPTP